MKPRGRPKKQRIVKEEPKIIRFSPRGKPGRPDETDLNIDEFEAIRLADLEGLTQDQVAKQMKVHRSTISRIIASAHKKIADAFVNIKAVKIKGGSCKVIGKQK